MLDAHLQKPKAVSGRSFLIFAFAGLAFIWGLYVLEILTPFRIGESDRDPFPIYLPSAGSAVLILSTAWRYWRAAEFAEGAITTEATVTKISQFSVDTTHRRVSIRYEVDGQVFERNVALYRSVAEHVRVGSKIEILVKRHAPKKIRIPANDQFLG